MTESNETRDRLDLSAALGYIRSRQTPAGGFSFYRGAGVEEPAAADTFYALGGLAALAGEPDRREACLDWLLERQTTAGGYSSLATAWYVSEALSCLGAAPRRAPSGWLAPYSERFFEGGQKFGNPHEYLLNLLFHVELCLRFEVPLEPRHRNALARNLIRLQNAEGAFPADDPNLPDTAIALRLMRATDLIAGRRMLEFARAGEDATYGFRASRVGQSTSLAVLAGGLAILAAFDVQPSCPRSLLHTVAACQHANGGFGHRAGAVPTLQDTYLALFIHGCIESHRGHDQKRNSHGF